MIKEIVERSSKRIYLDKKIPDTDIKTILEAGRLAPSWMNVQPWHFISVSNAETKELLSQLALGQKHVKTASHVILCLADTTAWDSSKFSKILEQRGVPQESINAIFENPALYPKLKGEERILLRTVEQCTYAMAYMTLQAEELGVGACVIGALGNELTEVNQEIYMELRKKLNIPERIYIMAMLTLGYDAKPELQTKKIRKEFSQVVSGEAYGQTF